MQKGRSEDRPFCRFRRGCQAALRLRRSADKNVTSTTNIGLLDMHHDIKQSQIHRIAARSECPIE